MRGTARRRLCRGHGCGVRYVGAACPACQTPRRPSCRPRHSRPTQRGLPAAVAWACPLTLVVAAALLLASADGRPLRVAPAPPRPSAAAPSGPWELGEPVVYRPDGRLYYYRGPARAAGRCLISVTAAGPTRQVPQSTLDTPTAD